MPSLFETTVRPDEPVTLLTTAEMAELYGRLLARHLTRILRLVELEREGEVVVADGVSLEASPEAATPGIEGRHLRYEALFSYSRNEPRLELIHKGLRRVLNHGRFLRKGQPIGVDGFRLRELSQWANCPIATLADNIGSISSYCNCDCEFCYEKGTRGAGIAMGRAQLSLREVDTRLRHYNPEKHTGLLFSSRYSLEVFANPHCLEILERVHAAAPDECTNLTTNGACLTEDVIARLARLRPVLVTVSMNAATVDLRLRTMRDRPRKGAEIAFASLPLMRKYELPFMASYVPWPSKPLSDLADTVRLIDSHDGALARVCMPSWTAYSAQEPPFDTAEYWGQIVGLIEELRQEVDIPIHLMPNMYQLRTLRPVVQGTIKHSPAATAGFKYGDLIVAVDGEHVFTRPEVTRFLAHRFHESDVTATRFTVERAGARMDIEVPHPPSLDALEYPYRWLADPKMPRSWAGSLGLHLADGFELTSFMNLKEIVEEYPGKRILLFVSELAEPYFFEGMQMLGEAAAFVDTVELHVQKLWPDTWGGNVMIGDLWTTRDIIEQTKSWIERNEVRPDLVIVPKTFLSRGGRDLLGRCYLDVERALDLEVRMLPCNRIGI